ncbi:MAG: ABC transporter permease [Candidatus Eremiobacteraeota bacterium]|nr:ABC transporter permease [Candidatus Eremiobacteraeota bacterium]MBV8355550.1 ABC transporter permease [Candidatus Eremiobacteraeota bacterium]
MIDFLWLTLIKSTPLIYAALGGVICERSGVINIGLEGMIAIGAFAGVAASYATGAALVGALAGILAGAILGAILGLAATRFSVEQIVAGTGINLIALGGAAYGIVVIFGHSGATSEVAALGSRGEAAMVVLALALAGALHLFLFKTRPGLHVRACGENPRAADVAGIDPLVVRFWATTAGGALAALGGIFLSLAELDLYSDGMSAGRGFIALAAVIFGRWNPLGATGAALFFGAFEALQFTLQRSGIPSELMQALPYLAALVALAGFAGRARPPASDGVPYVR